MAKKKEFNAKKEIEKIQKQIQVLEEAVKIINLDAFKHAQKK